MSVRADVINLYVNVNGNQAQNNLNELRKKAADTALEVAKLTKEEKQLGIQMKAADKEFKEVIKTYGYGTVESKKAGQAIGDLAKKMVEVDKSSTAAKSSLTELNIKIDAAKSKMGLAALSVKELKSEMGKLNALFNSAVPYSDEQKRLAKELKAVKDRLYDVTNGVQGFSSVFSKIGDKVKQFGLLAVGYLGFQFITAQFQNIIKGAGKLSDQLADLQRVAGLTAGEADNLNTKLKDLDTRTSASGLRDIAIIAGKLGVAKDDIFGFTKAVDQLVVSLGDELGSATEITDKLGKILNVFDGKITGDNITKLGNAFVELANTGAASGGFIADFDQRLAGIAKSANISLGSLSGLGAGLEELGGRVESSSTAIQKLVISIASDIPKAAKIAGMDVAEFNKLFANDPTEALLRYSQGLVKNKQSFSEVTAAFKDAGEEGARTIETITKLGTSADYLRGRIDLGKKSIQENSAITGAFALKNETFGATLDKLGKEFNKLVSNSALTSFLKSLAEGFLKLIGPAESLVDSFRKQQEFVKKLDTDIAPLISRYEELKSKSKLNKDEQVELNKAITAIGNTIPGAITQFDAYGRALGINAGKAREFINLQKAILKEKNRDAITDQEEELKKLQRNAEEFQKFLNSGKTTSFISGGSAGLGTSVSRNLSDKEIVGLQSKLAGLQERISGVKGIIQELKGDNLNVPAATKSDTVKTDLILPQSEEEKKAAEAARKTRDREAEAERKRKQAEYDKIKEEFAKFQLELAEIKRKSDEEGKDPQQKEIDAIQHKYDELLKRAAKYYDDLNAKDKTANKEKYTAEQQLIEDAYQQEVAASAKKFIALKATQQASRNDRNYKSAQGSQKDIEEQNRLALKQQYAAGTIDKATYEKGLVALAKSARENEITTAENWAKKSKQAAKDVVEFKKLQEGELTDAQILENEKRAENEAKAKDDKIQAAKDRIDEIINYAQQIGDIFSGINQLMVNKENALLQKDKAANDAKKKAYKEQLDQKLISKGQYDKKVTEADLEMDKKERALKRKQAEREKALNIFQAIINTAAAVAEALPIVPLAILAGVLGGIQIAAIATTPLPELGKGDWIRTGDKHSDASGGINAKIERDEAVMSAAAMRNSERFTISGSTAQITSALNRRVGGAAWASGASILPMWATAMPARINPGLPKIMEQGGIIRPINQSADGTGLSNDLLLQLIKEQQLNTQEIKTMKTKLHTVFSIKEFDETRAFYDAAKKASGF